MSRGGDTDIKPVPAIELEARIRRAHSLIWAGGRRDPLGTHQGAISHEHLAETRQRPEVRDRVPRQPQVRQPRHLRERPHVGHPVAVQQQHLQAVQPGQPRQRPEVRDPVAGQAQHPPYNFGHRSHGVFDARPFDANVEAC